MDTYFENDPVEQALPEIKRSPFADSEYMTPFDEKPSLKAESTPKKKDRKPLRPFLLTALLVIVCCVITAALVDARWQNKMSLSYQVMNNRLDVLQDQIDWLERINTENNQAASEEGMLTPGQVYAQNVSAVVAIASQSTTTNIYGQVSQTASSGSGFLISEDGYVVTNYHVVEGGTSLNVLTYDGDVHTAQMIGYDSANDICLLKIEGEGLPYVTLGSSDELGVGDQVAAIGNPLGELTSTLTVGYISAKDRVVTTDGTTINMLQTDAAINSGNSGGPLFNMRGEVVGITTAKYSGTSESGASIEGIGFAIPIDDVADMIQDLQEYGYISGAYLGVAVLDVSESAQMYGLPAGAYVEEVVSGSAADNAGIRVQDIIVNIGGYKTSSVSDLSRVLRKFKAGQTTTITVYRSGQLVDMSITFDTKPNETATLPENDQEEEDHNSWIPDGFPEEFFEFFFGN